MQETGWDAPKVAAVAKVSASAVYQWLGAGSKEIKSIGKIDAAIYLERSSGFSALWLAKGEGPKRAERTSGSDVTWPFPDLDFARFEALTANQKIEVQAAVRDRVERFESERSTKQAAAPPSPRKRA